MNRFTVRIFSALALALAIASPPLWARAASAAYAFDGTQFTFERLVDQPGGQAVAVDDPGLKAFLNHIAATIAWQPGQRFILVTTAQPVIVNFAVGDKRYDAGPISQDAAFAPFLLGGRAYVSFDALVHALGFAVKADGSRRILQPQLTSLEVQSDSGSLKLVAHAGMPLDGRIVSNQNGKTVVAFEGVASALPSSHSYDGAGVRRIDARTEGSLAHPRTIVTIVTAAAAGKAVAGTDDQRDFTLAYGAAQPPADQVGQQSAAPAAQAPASPGAAPSGAPVHVTAVQLTNANGAMSVRVSLDGPATYEWHRLRPPDNRVWIDVHNAKIGMPPQDVPVRVHQVNPQTVRIALSLAAYQTVDVVPDAQGISMNVGPQLADEGMPRAGSGTAGSPDAVAVAQNSPSPDDTWKFSPHASPSPSYVPANPRLIVLDPGHGGSDPGSMRGEYVEKALTLDISKRVRDILIKRGWQVMMTRDDDRDVAPHAQSDSDELQARDDVANNNGARLFLSIHINSFINAGPHGATTYFYKPEDYAFAQAIRRSIAAHVNVKDDGVVKDKLYVVHHAQMPAALVETAFISNPDDRALLGSPAWRQSMAQAIADGIADYAGSPPRATNAPGQ